MAKIERQKAVELSPQVRNKNFEEVSCGFTYESAMVEASRCLNCKNHPCVDGCPVNVAIPEFIAMVREGEIDKAYEIITKTSNLPSICGRVCPQENQCEKHCIRGKMEGAVAIGGLERFVADNRSKEKKQNSVINKNGKKVAIIGSGPSSLTCGADLAKAGFDVTIFEAFHKLGGVLLYGIPEFRLPKKLVQEEIDNLINLGVNVELNTVIGKTVFMEELINEYDAIYIGSGAGLPSFLNIEGENLRGVFSANEYLTRVNLMGAYKENSDTPIYRAKKAVVVGGGNVAMDGARTAKRLGASVTVVYRRSMTELPARREEVIHAQEEGVEFNLLVNPVKILGENGKVVGIECVKMMLGEEDESGRRSPVEIKDSNFIIPCDMVIVAVGTSPNPILTSSFDKLKLGKKGTIIVDESGMTSVENVYAGGDAVTGAATVILAMGAGKKAAKSIMERL